MSEEQRITKVEKEKDPRRVEAGKKLAAISREAKEKKAKQRAEAEKAHTEEESNSRDDVDSGEGLLDRSAALLTIISVVSGVVCLYFAYRQNSRAEKEMSTEKTVSTSSTSAKVIEEKQQTKSKPKMLSFGD